MGQDLEERSKQLIIRQLERRFGKISDEAKQQIDNLFLPQLEQLAEALLDFNNKTELTVWLREHA